MPAEDVKWFPHPKCSRPHGMWGAPDKDATEYEVTEFISSFIHLIKPLVVVETGSYLGYTTVMMAEALRKNRDDDAMVYTYEIDAERADYVKSMVPKNVRVYAKALEPDNCPANVDLAFLDSGMRTRQDDMNVIWPKVSPGGIVLVHDASPLRPPGKVRPKFNDYAIFDIATPRGLLVFQKAWR